MERNEKVESLREDDGVQEKKKGRGESRVDRQARQRIGTHLRAMYDTVLHQPVPDRFAELIARLDDGPAEAASGDAR